MFIKNCVFFPIDFTHPLHLEDQLILERDLNVQTLLLAGQFFVQPIAEPSAGEGEFAKIGNSCKIQYLINE